MSDDTSDYFGTGRLIPLSVPGLAGEITHLHQVVTELHKRIERLEDHASQPTLSISFTPDLGVVAEDLHADLNAFGASLDDCWGDLSQHERARLVAHLGHIHEELLERVDE